MVRVYSILVEYHQGGDVIGIGECTPRLSWKVDAGESKGWRQKAYELKIKSDGGDELYNGVVESTESAFIEWPAEPLKSRERVHVSVRVQGAEDDNWSAWSAPVLIEMGLLDNSEFDASFIGKDEPTDLREALFRKQFQVKGSIARARLYSSARGVYEVEINGRIVGKDALSPGWTSYNHRIVQRTDDIGELLASGENAVGIRLANGWYSGRLGFEGGVTNVYGDVDMAVAQLEITYTDGSVVKVGTDESWQWTHGPILTASLYDGEKYDATQEIPKWSCVDCSTSGWRKVKTYPINVPVTPPVAPPIRCTEVLRPKEIFKSASGKTVVDFGQNFTGVVHMRKTKAPKGHKVTIYHAEVMEDGELGTRPLRDAKCKDEYVFKGDDEGESWTPRFTYHGFRYIQVDNWPGELTLESLCAGLYNTDFSKTGWFECSNKLLNRLHENVCWSMRSNFTSVPTDCPQRDERLGWTGDIQLFGPTANYLYQCQGLLKNWLIDLADEQSDFGTPPVVCPTPLHKYENFWGNRPVAAWQDATVLVPWHVYQQTGDKEILRAQYKSMSGWLEQIPRDMKGEFWDPSVLQLGDWLDPDTPPDNPGKSKTDADMAANAYLVQSTEIVAQTAKLLNYPEDAEKYAKQTQTLRRRFAHEYITPAGRTISQSQTAYALVITMGLLDGENGSLWKPCSPEKLKVAGDMLAKIVKQDACQIGTGFLGTPIICDALVLTGHTDLAYKMLLNEKNPSWLYPVTMGATTTWERWDSILPNGKINPGEMTSFNHYAFGAVANWMHHAIAGVQPTAPGWKHVLIKPLLGGEITHASTTHDSIYGKISSSWKIENSTFSISISIPPNVTAVVHLPDNTTHDIGSGNHSYNVHLP